VYNYTRLYKKNASQVGFTIDDSMKYPAYFFTFFCNSNDEVLERSVHAIKEDKWVFYATGTPLVIEETGNYLKRKIKGRINNGIILDYLLKAGYDLKDNNFYNTEGQCLVYKQSAVSYRSN
jgi:hypothetical protein